MRRRPLSLLAVLLPWALPAPPARAQDVNRPARIGRLSPLSAEADVPMIEAFRKGLAELGWVEGRHYTIEALFADGAQEQLPALAAELVRRRVDLVLVGSNPGALALKRATRTIPAVMVTTADPVGGGVVDSLARPGGNVTGLTTLSHGLSAKRLQLLRELAPGNPRVAMLINPRTPHAGRFIEEHRQAARSLGLQLRIVEAHDAAGLDGAFQAIDRAGAGALTVPTDVLFINHRRQIVEMVAARSLPAVYGDRDFVDAGGLLFYGASLVHTYRLAAAYADKILKGSAPATLPVAQPTTFEMVINLRAARTMGLAIAQSLLLRADQLIE
jgi:putative tryptophan/tyrosine transport system substrate-binding protein